MVSSAARSAALASQAEAATASLTGRVVRADDPDYEAARTDWDGLFSHYPLAIVFCRDSDDVVNALSWARQHGLAVRARSGRHNLEGWPNVDGGLVIDVSEIKGVSLTSSRRTATVGAGLTQGEFVAALGRSGFATPTGSEASVGIVGATLGGGFGLLTRAFGLTCDNLIGAEIVVPTDPRGAALIEVGRRTNSDLLWACRGGGGGNFGIVTSLTYRVHPVSNVALLVARWPNLASLQGVFTAWQETAPRADRRLSRVLEVEPETFALHAVLVSGNQTEARQILRPLLSIGRPEVGVTVAGWTDVFAALQPGPRRFANWRFYSQFVTRPFPPQAIGIVREFMARSPSPASNFVCASLGGAAAREPAGGSAFPYRGALFYAEPRAGWNDTALTAHSQAWVAEFGQALRPYVGGAYVNVPNVAMANWPTAYYGVKYGRLRRIKARFDLVEPVPVPAEHPAGLGGVTAAPIAAAATALFVALGGESWATSLITTNQIKDGAITSSKIGNGQVHTNHLADGSITTSKLADHGVTNSKLANGSVGTRKLGNGAVTASKVAPNTFLPVDGVAADSGELGGRTANDFVQGNDRTTQNRIDVPVGSSAFLLEVGIGTFNASCLAGAKPQTSFTAEVAPLNEFNRRRRIRTRPTSTISTG